MSSVRFDTDVAQALRAHEDLQNAVEGINDAYEDTAKSAAALERAAARIVRANEGPQERYNRKIAELARLVKSGKLHIDDANRAAERYRRTLERQIEAQNRAYGRGAQSNVAGMVRQYVSVSAAISLGTRALQQFIEERKRAEQEVKQSPKGLAGLAQLAAVAEDPEAAFAEMLAEARRAFSAGVGESVDQAGDILFGLLSAGLDAADRKFAAALEASGAVTGVDEAASAFAALTKALGREEVGSFEDVISKALAASKGAPAKAPELVLAAAMSGGSARALGVSDEFLFAASEILAAKTGSASVGGTQLAAFLKGIESKGLTKDKSLAGLSGLQLVEELGSRKLDRAGIANLLGDRAEAIEGYRTLRDNLDQLRAEVADITGAPGRGVAQTAMNLPFTDPNLAAGLVAKQAGNARLLGAQDDPMTQLSLLLKAAHDENVTRRREQAERGERTVLGAEFMNLLEGWGVWKRHIEGQDYTRAMLGKVLEEPHSDQLLQQIRGVLEEIRDSGAVRGRGE